MLKNLVISSSVFLIVTSTFLKQDLQTAYVNFVGDGNENNNYTYTYRFNVPFRNTPTVVTGISDFSMTPNYNYLYFYISSWNSGDLSSQQFYFSNYQTTQLSAYFLAVDLNNVNFMSVQNTWSWYWYWWYYNYGYSNTTYNVNYSFNYNNSNSLAQSTDNFIAFTYLFYADIYSPDTIVFGLNCSVIDNQTVQINSLVDGNTNAWGYAYGLIVIDLNLVKNQSLNVSYTYLSSKTISVNFPRLKLTMAGLTGFNISSYMSNFSITLELETNNFIVSSNVNQANMSVISFFNSIDSSQLELAKRVQIAAEAIGLFVVVIGIYGNKLVGLQLIAVLQTAFFMLSTMDFVPEIINSFNVYHVSINGYNHLFQDFPVIPWGLPFKYKYSNIPGRLQNLSYEAEFLFNVNYMLLLNLALFVLGLLLKILKFPSRFVNVVKDLFFGVTIFNTMNIGFSMGAHINYFTRDPNIFYGNNACILVGLGLILTAGFIYATKQDDEFESYTKHLKQERQYHPLFHLAHKFLIALIMGFFTLYPKLTHVLVAVSGSYLLYIIISRPYKNYILQWRAALNEAVICLIAAVALYYQNYTNDVIINTTQYLAWLQNAMVIIVAGISAIVMLREVYLRCTEKKVETQTNQVKQGPSDNQEEGGKKEKVDRLELDSSQQNIEVIRFQEPEEQVGKEETKRKFKRRNNK